MSHRHEVALWAGISAFFGNLVGLKLLEVITGNDWARFAGAVLVSLLVAGAVYAKERLGDAKAARERSPGPPAD